MGGVTLGLKVAGMSGIDTLKEIRHINPDVMVIIITGFGSLATAIEAIRYGVFDYIPKPFNVPEIISIIDRSIQQRTINSKIKDFLGKYFSQNLLQGSAADPYPFLKNGIERIVDFKWDNVDHTNHQTYLEFAKVLAYTLEEKDPYTSGHSERVSHYANFISKRLSLSPEERNEVQIASYLHDIGKVGISDRFINKKEALNSTDWEIIKQHTKKSVELLGPLKLSPNIRAYIEHHHEHFDGMGYPDGLRGEQIPLGARIIAISDSYDSMTSDRPYRKPLPTREAKNELFTCAGT